MASQLPGGALWGGPSTVSGTIQVQSLINGALRIAGITKGPNRTPSADQYAEALPLLNEMIGSWNTDRMKIFTISVDAYTLTAGQKIYTIGGPGLNADFDAARPQEIVEANIIVNTTNPVVRTPVDLLTDQEWAAIAVQDIPNGIPSKLYNDGNYPLSSLYLWTQPLTTYQLELYTWQAIGTFATLTDAVSLPPGYELAIRYNLAVLLAQHYPLEAQIRPDAYRQARESLAAIQSINAPAPMMTCDRAVLNNRRYGWSYLTGR